MKKVKIVCALFLCMLCSCSIQNNDSVENNQNITISNSSDAPELTDENNVFNLSNVKLVDDYGYEPACVFYGDM